MNHEQAAKILRASVKDLSEPLKSAVEFTLANFYLPSAAKLAKNFLAGLPYEVFMARDLRDTNPTLKAKIDAAYFTIVNDENVWLGLDDLPHEEWRDVIGYEALYQVSNLGRVKSFFKGVFKIRKPVLSKPGYFGINLYKNNLSKIIRIHILVAQAFIPNPEGKPEVNHRFGNKRDNRVSELEWMTGSENKQHAYDIGLKKSGSDHPRAKFTAEQVRYIRNVCIPGDKEYGISALARKFGVSIGTISEMYHGDTYKNIT